MRTIILSRYLIIPLLIIILSSCAVIIRPSGGPPDKTPPVVVAYEPGNGTLNYDGKYIRLLFNKYMKKNEVIENIFLSPSKKMSYSWSGKELEIEILEPLDTNTTYSLMLGTEYSDYYWGNKPEQAFNLIFSTGNHLDSGAINGMLYDNNPSGVYIFAYNLTGINPDTLNIKHTKPNYWTQAGTNKKFQLRALKNGTYKLFAIRDQFKNAIYDEGSDGFGAADRDVIVNSIKTPYINLKVGPGIDKAGPMIYDVEALNNRHLSANFSEPLDTASISNKSFLIEDSTLSFKIPVISAFISPQSANSAEIITGKELDSGRRWKLIAVKDTTVALRDTIGNYIQDTARTVYFHSSQEKDTIHPVLLKSSIKDSSQNVSIDISISFYFNIAIIKDSIENRLQLYKMPKSDLLDYTLKNKSANIVMLQPKKRLLSDTWYELDFKLDSMAAVNRMTFGDTTLKIRFKTNDTRGYGGASGFLTDSAYCDGQYIINFISKDTKVVFPAIVADTGKWEIQELPQGIYTIEVICDFDMDGKYSYGNALPFVFAERFAVFEKEIEIKPRWTNAGIKLDMPK